jgi:chromosome segregation ATPase
VAADQQTRLNDLLASENALKQDLVILRADLTTSNAEVRVLSDTLKKQQDLLEQQAANGARSKADIEKLAAVVAPTASLVRFHEAQLKNAEEVLNHLVNQYTSFANAIGQNNEQIDSMIKDINSSFAQVKGTLDQMQQTLATIK